MALAVRAPTPTLFDGDGKLTRGATQQRWAWQAMVDVYASSMIPARIDNVWAYGRDFNGLPKYFPSVSESHIDNGMPSDRVGCIRSLRSRGDTGGGRSAGTVAPFAPAREVKHGSKSGILDAPPAAKQSE